jgi:hypothetical protein
LVDFLGWYRDWIFAGDEESLKRRRRRTDEEEAGESPSDTTGARQVHHLYFIEQISATGEYTHISNLMVLLAVDQRTKDRIYGLQDGYPEFHRCSIRSRSSCELRCMYCAGTTVLTVDLDCGFDHYCIMEHTMSAKNIREGLSSSSGTLCGIPTSMAVTLTPMPISGVQLTLSNVLTKVKDL